MNHDYLIVNTDTDSISFCKQDGSEFTKEEQQGLLNEINSLLPDMIKFEHDGMFEKVIVVKAKNYILYDGKKLKVKGSGLKKSTSESAIKEFCSSIIEDLIYNDGQNLINLYQNYIIEANNITDISRWCTRKTISEKVLNGTRANETKVLDAVSGTEFSEGDRIYLFFKEDGSLSTADKFDGGYLKKKYLEKVYNTIKTFETVIDISMFTKYHLKKNQEELKKLMETNL